MRFPLALLKDLAVHALSVAWEAVSRDRPGYSVGGGSYRFLGPLFVQSIASPRLQDGRSGEFVLRLGLKFRDASLYLHRMCAPDPGRDHHNHPWKAAFLVLSGGYAESRAVQVPHRHPVHEGALAGSHFPVLLRDVRPGTVNLIGQEVYHRVDRLLDGESSWTLGVVWDRRPSWGFWVPGEGHVDSAEYHRRLGGFTPSTAPAEPSPTRFDSTPSAPAEPSVDYLGKPLDADPASGEG